jgi:hypothetical protein
MFRERALPDLSNNIKCGNSLIGPDFYDTQQLTLLDEEDHYRLNVFDWAQEFEEVFSGDRPGFDAVIGNPPYLGGREWKAENGRQYDYFADKYEVAEYQFDIYVLFWEQGIRLSSDGGLISFITPNTWLNNQSNTKLRSFVLENTSVISITDYSRVSVFPKVVVLPIVTVLQRSEAGTEETKILEPIANGVELVHTVPSGFWREDDLRIINIGLRAEDIVIRRKVDSHADPLHQHAMIKFGIKLYESGKGKPPQKPSAAKNRIFEAEEKLEADYRPYLEGKDVHRYSIKWQQRWLKYGRNLAAPRNPVLFEGPRLLIRRIVGERLIGSYTDSDFVTGQLLQIVKPNQPDQAKFLLAVLNSSLTAYYFRKKYNRQDKTFPEIRIYELAALPIPVINTSDPRQSEVHSRLTRMADEISELNARRRDARTTHARNILDQQVAAADRRIDDLVFELYGLTDEQIAVVEAATA